MPVLRNKTGIFNNVSPTKDNWIPGGSGHSGITFNARIRKDGSIAELGIDTGDKARNKSIYHELKSKADCSDILKQYSLNWKEIPEKRLSVISINYDKYGLIDEEHWDEIANFLAESISGLITVFKPLLDVIIKSKSN